MYRDSRRILTSGRCGGSSAELRKCRPLLAVGEHGRRLGKDPSSRSVGFFRRRLPGGLAGEQNEEKVPGLEEKAVAEETIWDSEEAGFVLMVEVKSTPKLHLLSMSYIV